MANEIFKELKTRIALKTLSYSEWDAIKDTYKPLKGEVCVCEIPTGATVPTANSVTPPTVLFKIGDGVNVWSALNWASALAADVYAWAKKPTLDVNDLPTLPITIVDPDAATKKFITGISYADNKLTITRSNVALDDISDKEKIALSADLGTVSTLTTTAKTAVGAINEHDAEIGNLASLNTENKDNLVAAINEALQAVEVGGTGSVVTVTKEATPTTGSEVTYTVKQGGNAVDVKIEIPKYATSADYGVLGVAAGDDTITIGGTAQNPTVKVTENKFDAYGAAAKALEDAKRYADGKPHENTAHTHSGGEGLKVFGADNTIDGEVTYELNLAFADLTEDNKLQLIDAESKNVIAEFDASSFVEDSYLDSVTYSDENGDNILEFVFTLNNGTKKTVDVDLSHLVDVYTADETSLTLTTSGDGKVFKIKESGVETKHIKDGNVTEEKLEKDVTDALALARTAIQEHQTITTAVSNADDNAVKVTVNGTGVHKIAGSDTITVTATTASDADLVNIELNADATKRALSLKSAAYTESTAYATSAQGAKADSAVQSVSIGVVDPIAAPAIALTVDGTQTNIEFVGDNGVTVVGDNAETDTGKVNKITLGIDNTKVATAAQGQKADSALQGITTTANQGLKVSAKADGVQNIDIDTDVVFVLNCNW